MTSSSAIMLLANILLCLSFFESSIVIVVVDAWVVLSPSFKKTTKTTSISRSGNYDDDGDVVLSRRRMIAKDSWSLIDDWSSLSSEHPDNAIPDTDAIYNQDIAGNAARDMTDISTTISEEDLWINDIVDEIHNEFTTLDETPLYDTDFNEKKTTTTDDTNTVSQQSQQFSIDDMGSEIAMLVRCNEHPEELLISEGRALPTLTQEEKDDVSQLVTIVVDNENNNTFEKFEATEFLKNAVSKMFYKYAKKPSKSNNNKLDDDDDDDDENSVLLCMGRSEVANWMTRALKDDYPTSPHDSRVLKTISQYSQYGTGRLVIEDFQKMYLSVLVGDYDYYDGDGNGKNSNANTKRNKKQQQGRVSPQRHLQLRQPYVKSVWRDIRNHDILSPIELERKKLTDEIEARKQTAEQQQQAQAANANNANANTLLDECEILDWDYKPGYDSSTSSGNDDDYEQLENNKLQASGDRSSHKSVEMAPNTKTPLSIRDGEFVFIDEESCIGCMQCANVAPNSFLMLDNGRARTFKQRNSEDVNAAVASCPVNCMHPVSYPELEEYETARDKGDGRTDHKHLGHRRGHTPLYVAGIDSDNNHRTSWYHTLKGKCLVSSQCPQKGCYDCPKYGKPGENPYFQKRLREDEHVRAQFFIDRGDVDGFRKVADL